MTTTQMHNMTQQRFLSDADLEYAQDLDRYNRSVQRRESANMQSDDYYTGMGEDEPETDENE